jgi:hypothetical protein
MFRMFRRTAPVPLDDLRREAATPFGAVWSCSADERRREDATGGEVKDESRRLSIGDILVLRDSEDPRAVVKLRVIERHDGHVQVERIREG